MKYIHVNSTTKLAPPPPRSNKMKSFTGTHPLIEEYGAIRAELARVEAERDELRKKMDAIGDGWEIIDDVEYPVGCVVVLTMRHAIWNVNAEEWQDVLTNNYIRGVVAYRDLLPPQDMTP